MVFRLCLIAAMLMLSACSVFTREASPPETQPPVLSSGKAPAEKPRPETEPVPEVRNVPPAYTLPEAKQRPVAPATKELPTTDITGTADLNDLLGAEADRVENLMGPPTDKQDVPPAQIWHYRDGDCTVSIGFYPDMQALKYHALTIETNMKDAGKDAAKRCFTRIKAKFYRQP